MSSNLVVREATQNDVPTLASIWIEGNKFQFKGNHYQPIFDIDDIIKQIHIQVARQDENFKFWVCQSNEGDILGYSTIQPFHPTPDKNVRNSIGITSTYIHPLFHGKGLGKLLLGHVIDYSRNHTQIKHIIDLRVPTNTGSVKLTTSLGYTSIGQLPQCEGFPTMDLITLTI